MSLTAIANQPIGFATSFLQGCLCDQPEDKLIVSSGDTLLFQFQQTTCEEEQILPHPHFTDEEAWSNWIFSDGTACWEEGYRETMEELTFSPTPGTLYYLVVTVTEYIGTSGVQWTCGGESGMITGVGTYTFTFEASVTAPLMFTALEGMVSVCFSGVELYVQSTDVVVEVLDMEGTEIDDFSYASDPDYFTYAGPFLTVEIPVDAAWGCFTLQVTEECLRDTLTSQQIQVVDENCTLLIRACNAGANMGFSAGFQPTMRVRAKITRPTFLYDESVERNTAGRVDNYYGERIRTMELRVDQMGEKAHEFLSSLPLWDHVYIGDIEYHVKGEAYEPAYGDVWESHGGILMPIEPKEDPLRKVRCGPDLGCDPLNPEPVPPFGTNDPDFNIGGLNNEVFELRVTTGRKILCVGTFTLFNATTVNRVARLNPDGTLDAAFTTNSGSGFNAGAQTMEEIGLYAYIGGPFTTYDGATVNRIVRLDPDGLLDATFATGTAFDGTVTDMVLVPGGSLFVIGAFQNYDGTGANRIISLGSDGSIDTSFSYGTGFNNQADRIALQPDGKILVSGQFFTSYNGTGSLQPGACTIVRINFDGTFDSIIAQGTQFNDLVRGMTVQPDGKIIVTGEFTDYNGTACGHIIRLNSDGTPDTDFVTNTGDGFSDWTTTSKVLSDGRIIVGVYNASSTFDTVNPTRGLVCLNPDGTMDTSFNSSGVGFDARTNYTDLDTFDDSLVVGGAFQNVNGIQRKRVARYL